MEKTVSELADLVKKMQDDRLANRAANREAVKLLQESLDANTLVMKDVVKWRPSVDYKVDELRESVRNLQHKVEKMAVRQEELANPAHKVFESSGGYATRASRAMTLDVGRIFAYCSYSRLKVQVQLAVVSPLVALVVTQAQLRPCSRVRTLTSPSRSRHPPTWVRPRPRRLQGLMATVQQQITGDQAMGLSPP
ncbi:unnamed protein product [Urochloa humidicola]